VEEGGREKGRRRSQNKKCLGRNTGDRIKRSECKRKKGKEPRNDFPRRFSHCSNNMKKPLGAMATRRPKFVQVCI
jgi:hypothetical protein